jgi:hypothetical protein
VVTPFLALFLNKDHTVAAAPPTPPRGPPRLGSIHHVRGRDPDQVPRSATRATEAPHCGVDQRPQRGGHTEGVIGTCLNMLDRCRGERHVGVGERSQSAAVCVQEPSGRGKLSTCSYDTSFAFWRSNSSGVKIPWSRSAASLASSSATERSGVTGPSPVTLSTG